MNNQKQMFIIATKNSYDLVENKLINIIDKENVSPIMPYGYYNDIDNIISNNSNYYLIQSDVGVMNSPSSLTLTKDEIINLRNKEAIKHSYNEWLNKKFEFSKEKILNADICLVITGNDEDKMAIKEIYKEIQFAKNKNIPIIEYNKNKQYILYNENKAA